MFFKEEKQRYIEEELTRIINERPQLTYRERRIMRDYLAKEFEDVWQNRDYVYGQDEGGSPAGSKD